MLTNNMRAMAVQLAQVIPGCITIWKWDAARQQWLGHVAGSGLYNFATKTGEAYVVETE